MPDHRVSAWGLYRFKWRLGVAKGLAGVDYFRSAEYPWVLRRLVLHPDARLVDVGSATSLLPAYVAWSAGCRVLALDIDPAVKEEGRYAIRLRLGGRLVAIVGDARSLPLGSESVDYVTCVSAIEHIPGDGDTQAIVEIVRVLAPGGRLVLTVPYADRHKDIWMSIGNSRHFNERHYDDTSLQGRLIGPSGLRVAERRFIVERELAFSRLTTRARLLTRLLRPLTPWLASRFLVESDAPPPPSAAGVCALVLIKEP